MKYTIIKISSLLFCLSKYPALLWQLHQLLQTHCSTTAVVYLTLSLQQVFKRDDLSRRTLSMVLADVHGGVTTEVCDFISNTEQRRSRDVPPAWNNLIFSDGLPGVGTVSDSLSVARPRNISTRSSQIRNYWTCSCTHHYNNSNTVPVCICSIKSTKNNTSYGHARCIGRQRILSFA